MSGCCCLVTKLCPTLCDPHGLQQARLPVLHLPEFAQTHVHFVSDAIQPSHPLPPLLRLPSIFLSVRVFPSDSALCIWWPKYWSVRVSISPSDEYSGLISFRIDWFDLLVVQGILKSLPSPQFKSINSLALSLLYGPILTSIQDSWKNHSFDYENI